MNKTEMLKQALSDLEVGESLKMNYSPSTRVIVMNQAKILGISIKTRKLKDSDELIVTRQDSKAIEITRIPAGQNAEYVVSKTAKRVPPSRALTDSEILGLVRI